jgi:hypothetical protein
MNPFVSPKSQALDINGYREGGYLHGLVIITEDV